MHGWHKQRGFSGFGYNFWANKQGQGFIGRGWNQGAHARGHNTTKIGVGLQGDFHRNNSMTDAQVTFAIDIVKHIYSVLGRKVPIYIHGEVGVTACAGRHFRLNEVRAGLNTTQPSKGGSQTVILRRGSKGANVGQLQRDLLQLGYSLPRFGADNDYGAETENTVRQFQRDHGLTADGVAGPMTFGKIEALLAAEIELYRVQVGAFSDPANAKKMEEALKKAGFDTYIVKG